MKLLLGGGQQKIEGFLNVDLCDEADVKHDLRNPLPFDEVEEIMAVHVIESFYRWELPAILSDWRRVLKGRMTIEFTDLNDCVDLYKSNNEDEHRSGKWGLYGNQERAVDPIVLHKYDYTVKELEQLLIEAGFKIIEFTRAGVQHNPKRDWRVICE
jgi:predicted SAM-dependent methyltransferase